MYVKMSPNMMVEDVQRTIKFYRDLIGFDFVMAVPMDRREVLMETPGNERLAYAMMKRGNVEMMFQARESLSEDIPAFLGVGVGASVSFYFEVENIQEHYEKLKDKVTVVKAISTTWYGMREFYIKDCNGYILGFSQREPS